MLVEIEVAPPTRLPSATASSIWRWSTTPPACSARCVRKIASRRFASCVRVLRPGGRVLIVGAVPRGGLGAVLSRTQNGPPFVASGDASRGARGRRLQVGAHAGRARGAGLRRRHQAAPSKRQADSPVTAGAQPGAPSAAAERRSFAAKRPKRIGQEFCPAGPAVATCVPHPHTTCIRRRDRAGRRRRPKPTCWPSSAQAARLVPHARSRARRADCCVPARAPRTEPAPHGDVAVLAVLGQRCPARRRAGLAARAVEHAARGLHRRRGVPRDVQPDAARRVAAARRSPADPMRLVFVATPDPAAAAAAAGCCRTRRRRRRCAKAAARSAARFPSGASRSRCGRFPRRPNRCRRRCSRPSRCPRSSRRSSPRRPTRARAPASCEQTTAETDSHGPGTGGGAGTGTGTGLGSGDGSGIGPGSGGGTGGGPYRPGSGIEPPRLLREVKADYTEDARRRGVSGDVVLEIVVRRDGIGRRREGAADSPAG